jgi:hypothetical protein
MLDTSLKISTFGEDEGGELYLAHRNSSNGIIYQIMDVCESDFDGDGDVDGSDLADNIADQAGTSLDDFAAEFGSTYCP